jgi:hypothetical protein
MSMKYTKYKKCACGHTKNVHTRNCLRVDSETNQPVEGSSCRGAYCDCIEYTPQQKKPKEAEHARYKNR